MSVDVREILPHRYPFLLVDAFVSQEGDSFECIKNVSHGEPYFQGHFAENPIMPGVLIVEALAQAALVGVTIRDGLEPGAIGYFARMEAVAFKREVVPGDQLRLTGTIIRFRRGVLTVDARALVGEDEVASSKLTLVFAETFMQHGPRVRPDAAPDGVASDSVQSTS